MLTFTSGNLLEKDADIRINTVNCVGVMGAGLALAFKTKYPAMFRDYQRACKSGEVKPGKLHVWKDLYGGWIINFPTKRHWREPSRYEDIEKGLIALKNYLADQGKLKVLLPAVGCGHGGLDWSRISEMIRKHLKDLESDIIVFEPADSREAGNKIRQSEEEAIQGRLIENGIQTLEPGDEFYPPALRGRSAARLYIKGNLQQHTMPTLLLLPSVKPSEREIEAAMKAVSISARPGVSLLVGYGAAVERPAIKLALERGADIVIFISEGILRFQVRRDLLDVWNENRITILSAAKPLERWSPSAAFRTKDLQLSMATTTLITDNSVQANSKMLLQKASLHLPPIFYIDYGEIDLHATDIYKKIKAQPIQVNEILSDDTTDAFSGLMQALGAIEATAEGPLAASQTISEQPVHYDSLPADKPTDKEEGVSVKGTMQGTPRRLIEVDLPIKRISAHARREKSIRHGHISTLHIWWARRPLAACRAVICAALWPDPADPRCPDSFRETARQHMQEWAEKHPKLLSSQESIKRFIQIAKNPDTLQDDIFLRQALLDFIADFANWDNSTVREYLDTSRALTQAAHEALGGEPGTRPLVVDPFAGGGSIPLEALRVGADAFASDLNPVAVLLNKVVLEYIPKYGQRLADEVRKWGDLIKKEAEKELSEFFPVDSDGAIPIAYIWARRIKCEGPKCGTEVPLIKSLWLARKSKHSTALELLVDAKSKKIGINIVHNAKAVGAGTTLGGAVTCPVCGYTTPVERVRAQMCEQVGGANNARLIVVVTTRPNTSGRSYRLPVEKDLLAVKKAATKLSSICASQLGMVSHIPDEPINHLRGFFNVVLYGMKTWGNLFTTRQALTLVLLCDLIRSMIRRIANANDPELIRAVQVCMALSLGKQADRNSAVCRWISQNEATGYTFGRQALPMNWDFVEMSPLRSSGAWSGIIGDTIEVIESQNTQKYAGTAIQSSANDLPLPDNSAQLLFTDPPYYSAIPYADLSDFFYVWLKRALFDSLPDLFAYSLAPKDQECVALSHRAAMYRNKDSLWFETEIGKACQRARTVVKREGIGCFVFANKETAGWEAMLKGIIDNGWIVTASWPIDTERPGRLRAQNSAALASSIHIVCRPRRNKKLSDSVPANDTGDWREILSALPRRVHEWLPRLAEEGVVGADAIFACLGPALEIFSRYSRVEKASGEQVSLKEYLEQVWAAVSREALAMIFSGADATGFEEDARLTAMWLWTLSTGGNGSNDKEITGNEEPGSDDEEESKKTRPMAGYVLEYDAARKIAQGLGAHLDKLKSLIEVKGETARLLPVAERATYLFGKDAGQAPTKRKKKDSQLSLFEFIDQEEFEEGGWQVEAIAKVGHTALDQLHQGMILFAAGRGEALKRFLVEEGIGRDQRFWRLAQALSALYPSKSDEKRWVDGVLARKKGLGF